MSQLVVISFSGGLDSATLLKQLVEENKEVHAVNFNYGSKHNRVERSFAKVFCESIGVKYIEIELPFVGKLFKSNLLQGGDTIPSSGYDKETMEKTVVPGRNGIFLSILAGYAESVGAREIALANHAGDHCLYPDCRPEWIEALNKAIQLGSEGKVKIVAPFSHLSKANIIALGIKMKMDYTKTWSCYNGGSIHCGECGTCTDRKKGFQEIQIEDPTQYKV